MSFKTTIPVTVLLTAYVLSVNIPEYQSFAGKHIISLQDIVRQRLLPAVDNHPLPMFLSGTVLAEHRPAPPDSTKKRPAKDFYDLLQQGDSAFYTMNYEKADSLYSIVLDMRPDNAAVNWRLARLYVSMGEALPPENTDERQPYYTKAVQHAETCIGNDDHIAEGHTWLAASLGVLADNIGPREKIKRVNSIKSELDRALELNPEDDVALSILGSFNREIAGMGWLEKVFAKTFLGSLPEGSYEEAEEMLKRAIVSNPRVIRHYHELGKLYSDMKRYQEAVDVLQEALTKPVLMKSDERRLKNIRTLIKKLSRKID